MRYIIAREAHQCVVCKEDIEKGEVCIQSEGFTHLFYHEDCHTERFGASIWHRPRMTKTVREHLERIE